MTRKTGRNHTPAFKAQVALAALKSDKTLAELAQQYDIHPNQITDWKRQLTERAVQVFGDAGSPASIRSPANGCCAICCAPRVSRPGANTSAR